MERSGVFEVLREPLQYMCFFRSIKSGRHFGVERVTEGHINVWVSPTPAVVKAANSEGIVIGSVSKPYPDPADPTKYGRIASLKSDPTLRDADLLCIPVTSGSQAVRILSEL